MRDRVFVSYRRSIDLAAAQTLVLALQKRLSEEQLFYAELDSSIPPVSHWKEQIDAGLDASAVFVLVMGPDWLDELRRRSSDERTDYQLYEISRALEAGLPIVWVLMNGAGDRPPEAADLPEEIRQLSAVQAYDLSPRHFHRLIDGLLDRVVALLGDSSAPDRARVARGPSAAGELLVGSIESGAPYREIADAVADAGAGSIVKVLPGTYRKPVVVHRPMTILGESPESAVLKAPGVCVEVLADDVAIGQLGIVVGDRDDGIGVRVSGADLLVDGCDVAGGLNPGSTGISIVDGARGAVVRSTEVHHLERGVHVGGASAVADGAVGLAHRVESCRFGSIQRIGIVAEACILDVVDCEFKRMEGSSVAAEQRARVVVEGSRFGGKERRYRSESGGHLSVRGARGRAGGARDVTLALGLGLLDKLDLTAVRDRHQRGERVRLSDAYMGDTDDVDVVVDGGHAQVEGSDLEWVSVEHEGSVQLVDCNTAALYVGGRSTVELLDSSVERIGCEGASTVTLRRTAVRAVWKDSKLKYHPPAINVRDGSTLRLVDGTDLDTSQRNSMNSNAVCGGVAADDAHVEVERSKVQGLRAPAISMTGGVLTLKDATIEGRSMSSTLHAVELSDGAELTCTSSTIEGRVSLSDVRATCEDTRFKGGFLVERGGASLLGCRVDMDMLSGRIAVGAAAEVTMSGGTVKTDVAVDGEDARLVAREVQFVGSLKPARGLVELTGCDVSDRLTVGDLPVVLTMTGGRLRSATLGCPATLTGTVVGSLDVTANQIRLTDCEVSGRVLVAPGAHARLNDTRLAGFGATGDGPDDAALVVQAEGLLDVQGGSVSDPSPIKPPLVRFTRAAKERAARLEQLGGSRVLSVQAGGRARLLSVEFSGLGADPVDVAPGGRADFSGCTLDGTSWSPAL